MSPEGRLPSDGDIDRLLSGIRGSNRVPENGCDLVIYESCNPDYRSRTTDLESWEIRACIVNLLAAMQTMLGAEGMTGSQREAVISLARGASPATERVLDCLREGEGNA